MNTHEKFIRETNQFDNYVEWLEAQITSVKGKNLLEIDEQYHKRENITKRLIDSFPETKDFNTKVWYDAIDLSYEVQIIFPKLLDSVQKERVENIITYWSHIPYVTTEGHYGIEWDMPRENSVALISIDFTKSASDDYGAREILEKLADWVENGTPVKADRTQKYEGVMRPMIVRADSV